MEKNGRKGGIDMEGKEGLKTRANAHKHEDGETDLR
jgi:hypothetical protein